MWDSEQMVQSRKLHSIYILALFQKEKISNLSYSLLSILKKELVGRCIWPFKEAACAMTPAKGNLNTTLQILHWSVRWLWVLAEVILGTLHIHKKEFTANWNKYLEIILAGNSHSKKSYLNSFCACIQLDAVEQEHIWNAISSQIFSLSKMTLEKVAVLLQVS